MSVSKKNKLLRRMWLPLELLEDNPDNPNILSDRGFDMLTQNIEDVGFTDAMLVWPRGMLQQFEQVVKDAEKAGLKPGADEPEKQFCEMLKSAGIHFQFVGGHHRRQSLQYLGELYGPCTVIVDPEFDDEAAEAQLMRNNLIHGKIDPTKFMKMAQRQMDKGLTEDQLQILYGFADEAEFKRLVDVLAKDLPNKELQDKFKKAAEEVKTIDGLTKLLNKMFTMYGDTLPYGFMVVDYGGQQNIWLRISKKTHDAMTLIGDACIENQVTMDDLIGEVVQSIARGDASEILTEALEKAPKVQIPKGFVASPTKENLQKAEAI
jgi:ParB-like chromosome segregation protein Spo0J